MSLSFKTDTKSTKLVGMATDSKSLLSKLTAKSSLSGLGSSSSLTSKSSFGQFGLLTSTGKSSRLFERSLSASSTSSSKDANAGLSTKQRSTEKGVGGIPTSSSKEQKLAIKIPKDKKEKKEKREVNATSQSLATQGRLQLRTCLTGIGVSSPALTGSSQRLGLTSSSLKSFGTSSSLSLSSGTSLSLTSSILGSKLPKNTKSTKVAKTGNVDGKRWEKAYTDYAIPEYDFKGEEDQLEVEIPEFVAPDIDMEIHRSLKTIKGVTVVKISLVNGVSASLLGNPDFHNRQDATRQHLMNLVDKVIAYDPEFVLKVALYARRELNIRTTADYLLALSAHKHPCRPFLKKYFNAAIRLPSDWIDVAEVYQTFYDKSINFGSLPSALRKAMVAKFPEFDSYQLAKYNKDKKKKKVGGAKKKEDKEVEGSEKEEDESGNVSRQISYLSEQSETEEELIRLTFTLKQLIRKLHITAPVESVMSLIGKRYPEDNDSFRKSGLSGEWDPDRAGKRMKLPTPETWETQVSLKGNKASTWEDLIDHKKLPFMAMLRNIRNMLNAGISDKHHAWILRKLTDERSVVNSKQFPFRFFSAYEVLGDLERALKRQGDKQDIYFTFKSETSYQVGRGRGGAMRGGRGRGRGRGAGGAGRGGYGQKKKPVGDLKFSMQMLTKYRKALDTAVKIATCYNVKPISGTTVLFCNVGNNMNRPCTSARFGKSKTVLEVGVLLGLMCKYSCEDCQMIACGPADNYKRVELEKGTILDNMQKLLQYAKDFELIASRGCIPVDMLRDILRDRQQIDNLIVLSDGMNMCEQTENQAIMDFLEKYRHLVNPNLLFVNVDLSGAKTGFTEEKSSSHPNDIYIAGYSDQILSFIAERGDAGQLAHVEKIDEAYKLRPMQTAAIGRGILSTTQTNNDNIEKPLPVISSTPRWRTAKVFISSTFRDMHSERDLLTRFVFPELRARAKKHFINVYEVDLRWGVTEEEAKSNKSIEICLSEVSRCDFFIGILGERYGWIPDNYVAPDTEDYDWLKDYPSHRSITELEMEHAGLGDPINAVGKAFFYLRNNEFISSIPVKQKGNFEAESNASKDKITNLKERIRTSGLEVFNGYPCDVTGESMDNIPILGGLEDFGARVLNNLWNAIIKKFPDEDAVQDEISHDASLHEACLENHLQTFVGRKTVIKQSINAIETSKNGLVIITGTAGAGKSALMAALTKKCMEKKSLSDSQHVIPHFIGAVPGSTNIVAMLKRLCHELQRRFGLSVEIPNDFKNLMSQLPEILKEAAMQAGALPIVLCIDGLDLLEDVHQAKNMEWMPLPLPEGVKFVMSCIEDGPCHKALLRYMYKAACIKIGSLDMWDKAEMVRKSLAVHRKTLDESPFNNQMKLLLSKREAGIPLFLSLACEELRVFGIFEKVSQRIKSMAQTVSALLQEVMIRLEIDHGKQLISTALSLLVCVRDGLLEDELHALLSISEMMGDMKYSYDDIKNIHLSADQYLPQANFARLIRGLQSFIRPLGEHSVTRLCLAHTEIVKSIRQRYMKTAGTDYETMLHKLIAGYFHNEADPQRNGTWFGKKPRPLCELPYHLASAIAYKELEVALCNLNFIKAKCMMGMAGQLMEDFIAQGNSATKMTQREQERFLGKENVKAFRSFVSRNLHILANYPALTLQQAMNEPSDTIPAKMAAKMIDSLTPVNQKMVIWSNKHEEEDPCAMTLSGQSDTVTCVAVSTDNSYFAVGTRDCSLKMYDMITGKEVMSFTGHSGSISDCCFTGKNKLCSASWDGTLSLWDIKDGHRIEVMKGHTRRVNSCCANTQGTYIVSASWDCVIKVWNALNGSLVTDLRGDKRPVNCVAFHPEGQKLVSGSWDATMKIWDIFHKRRIAVLRGHKTAIRDCAFSPSGRHIASASLDGDVKLWSARTGTQVGSISGHSLPINKLTFSPSGEQLITVSDDHKVKVWSGHLGRTTQCLGSGDFYSANCVAINPAGTEVVIGYQDEWTRLYDLRTGVEKWAVKHHTMRVRCVTWCAADDFDSAKIITGSEDSLIKIMDAETGRLLHTLIGYSKPVMSVKYNANTRLIAATSEDTLVYLWKMPTSCDLSLMMDFDDKSSTTDVRPDKILVSGCSGSVSSCDFNPDGTKLVTVTRDAMMMLWDVGPSDLYGVNEITPSKTLRACHQDWINDCAWSDIGDLVVTASNDFTLKIWDILKGKEKLKLVGHTSAINSVAFKHGCIVSACYDGSVKVWSHRGAEITTLTGHQDRVNGCDIFISAGDNKILESKTESNWGVEVEAEEAKNDEDSKKNINLDDVVVATASDDGTVKIWKPLVGNELASLTGHSDRVLGVAMTTDGRQIITTSMDKSIKLWSPNLTMSTTFASHNSEVCNVAFSPNGVFVVSASRDGNLIVLKFDESDEGTHDIPRIIINQKFSEKSINTVNFITSNKFVVGGDDGTTVVMEIEESNLSGGLGWHLREVYKIDGILPITSIAVNSYRNEIAIGRWNNVITTYSSINGKQVKKYQSKLPDWVLRVKYASNYSTLVATGTDGTMECFAKSGAGIHMSNMDVDETSWLRALECIPLSQGDLGDICGTDTGNVIITGSSTGHVTVFHMEMQKICYQKKIHTAPITDIKVTNGLILTGSHDRTVKIWNSSDFKQIGQFFCQAPVTCIAKSPQLGNMGFICGDTLGNLYFLKWQS
ncbi:telomerase protein component 1-like [Glandiceps talaboti]